MNDYKQNWFYKMCKKQCLKDSGFIIAGAALFLAGILLFLAVISALNIALSLVGLGLVLKGIYALCFKLPKLGRYMEMLSDAELADLGDAPPQEMHYGTFYCTGQFLCAPYSYALIRFVDIEDVAANVVTSNGRQSGMFINITFSDGSPSVDINIKNWGTFQKEASQFFAMIAAKREAALQML